MIKMTKKEKFVTIVQTAAIVESLSRVDLSSQSIKPSVLAAMATDVALQIPERQLPEDLYTACSELISYVYDNTIPKPMWLSEIS